jgi:hypothetical protein
MPIPQSLDLLSTNMPYISGENSRKKVLNFENYYDRSAE